LIKRDDREDETIIIEEVFIGLADIGDGSGDAFVVCVISEYFGAGRRSRTGLLLAGSE
jgi:hypothetical protein